MSDDIGEIVRELRKAASVSVIGQLHLAKETIEWKAADALERLGAERDRRGAWVTLDQYTHEVKRADDAEARAEAANKEWSEAYKDQAAECLYWKHKAEAAEARRHRPG